MCRRDFAANPEGRTNLSVFAVNKPVSGICVFVTFVFHLIARIIFHSIWGQLFVLNNKYPSDEGSIGGRKFRGRDELLMGFQQQQQQQWQPVQQHVLENLIGPLLISQKLGYKTGTHYNKEDIFFFD